MIIIIIHLLVGMPLLSFNNAYIIKNTCIDEDDTPKECFNNNIQSQHETLISSLPTNKFYINGTWTTPASSLEFSLLNPSTKEKLTTISEATKHDVNQAVKSAKEAFPSWSIASLEERIKLVQQLLTLYQEKYDLMGTLISLEMGAPASLQDSQAGAGEFIIQHFLEEIKYFSLIEYYDEEDESQVIINEPIGVVGLITPWNWPMNQITLKVIPALLVGCTTILKPSEESPLNAILFAQLIHQAGFPPGVFNLLHGSAKTGSYISQHLNIDMISFTGSTKVGRQISRDASENFKRVSLEMGGKGASIVFEDILELYDLEEVIEETVLSAFSNAGQTCNAPTRLLVQESIYDEAVKLTTELVLTSIQIEPNAKEEDQRLNMIVGPLINEVQYHKVSNYIQTGIKEGATLVAGGTNSHQTNYSGYYIEPTLFVNCHSNMTIMQQEIFGPVLCIAKFSTEQEAIDITNDTPYGLTNYLYTNDSKRKYRMARRIHSGMIDINGIGLGYRSPFGGVKYSGTSREGGIWGLLDFCIVKAVAGLE